MRRWQDGEWACSRRICLIPDVGDADGDPDTTVVLFDRSFGHAASPLLRGGYPVLQVLVTAERGGEPPGDRGRGGAGDLRAGHRRRVGGRRAARPGGRHPGCRRGTSSGHGGRSPGAALRRAVIEGEQVADPQLPLPAGVLEILNAGGTLSRLDELPEPIAGRHRTGCSGRAAIIPAPSTAAGIFIVHNPAFDPVKHEASRIAIEEGVLARGMTRPTPTSTRPGSPRVWTCRPAGRLTG